MWKEGLFCFGGGGVFFFGGWLGGWVVVFVGGWMDEWMDEWMDAWRDKKVDRYLVTQAPSQSTQRHRPTQTRKKRAISITPKYCGCCARFLQKPPRSSLLFERTRVCVWVQAQANIHTPKSPLKAYRNDTPTKWKKIEKFPLI